MNDASIMKEYIETGSETAFRSLVQEHLDLVFGTACRRLQNPALAEEVSQQVFILLAQKLPLLRFRKNLAGWLYKTTLLKAGELERAECRRHRREQAAFHLGLSMRDDPSLIQSMTEVLDEALLDLCQKDRQAILLRYMENKSLRMVGDGLGIKEGAAQKRLAKALSALVKAFRKRGFAPSSSAIVIAVLETSGRRAPAGLAPAIAAAVKTAGPATITVFGWLLSQLANLTKVKQAAAVLVLAAAPLGYQQYALEQNQAIQASLQKQVLTETESARRLAVNRQRSLRELASIRAACDLLQTTLASRNSAAAPSQADIYRWVEDSDYVQAPRSILDKIILAEEDDSILAGDELVRGKPHPVIKPNGAISGIFAGTLRLNESQTAAVNQSLFRAFEELEAIAQKHTHPTNALPFYAASAKSMTIATDPFPSEASSIETRLKQELKDILGAELASVFWIQAKKDLSFHLNDFGRAARITNMAYDTRFNTRQFYLSADVFEGEPSEGDPSFSLESMEMPDMNVILESGGFGQWFESQYGALPRPVIREARQSRGISPESFPAGLRRWWPDVFSTPIEHQSEKP